MIQKRGKWCRTVMAKRFKRWWFWRYAKNGPHPFSTVFHRFPPFSHRVFSALHSHCQRTHTILRSGACALSSFKYCMRILCYRSWSSYTVRDRVINLIRHPGWFEPIHELCTDYFLLEDSVAIVLLADPECFRYPAKDYIL